MVLKLNLPYDTVQFLEDYVGGREDGMTIEQLMAHVFKIEHMDIIDHLFMTEEEWQ